MKIFLSWSGIRSKAVATALRQWIPDVIQTVEPWMSQTDIDAGARWNRDIDVKLSETKFGIICLTKSNCDAPWILFETGALAKTITDTFVCPYLIDLAPSEIPQGPLTQFQAKSADRHETWELICTINKALREEALPEEKLRRTYERWWPDLESVLNNLPKEEIDTETRRPVDEMLAEVLELVRGLSRRPFPESEESRQSATRNNPLTEIIREVIDRDGAKCAVCGSTEKLKLAHIVPISQGGSHDVENLQLLCLAHKLASYGVLQSDQSRV